MQWFRFYNDTMRHPKVARLTDAQFRLWAELLCVASENEGAIPAAEDLKHVLKRRLDHLLTGLEGLLKAGLIVRYGDGFQPHNWDKRQYKSDSSAERVRKHREEKKRYSNALDTETDTETEVTPKGVCASDDAPAFDVNDFVESWNETAEACGLSKIRKLTDARKRAFNVRRREYPDIADWQRAFTCLRQNKWMHGDNRNGWRADPDFFLTASKFTKLVEGQYGQADRP
jgi:hypothetical protein